MQTYETVRCDREDHVVVVTINRPEKLNALNEQLVRELTAAIDELDNDPSVYAVVLTGAGDKAFVAGADIEAMSDMTPAQGKAFADKGHALMNRIEQAHFPVIGALNGFALGGGCELALACDFVYASDKAKLGLPEVSLGIMPGFGGTQRLGRRIGPGHARELCFTGDMIDAEQALRVGLVNAVVPHAELLNKVKEVAKKIASRGPVAIAQAKRVMVRGADVPLPVALELEGQAFGQLFGTEDQREGMKAFISKPKRSPTFVGK